MNRDAFFSALRQSKSVFGTSLSQRQVDGLNAILDNAVGLSLPHLAHVLAECYHETGGGMYPVKETVFRHSKDKNPSNATVIARLDRAFAKGQLPWVKSPYWRDGWFGRGIIQLTHRSNYERLSPVVGVDLTSNPDAALDPSISALIAIKGCEGGLFTGKALKDYDAPGGYDHRNARAIVNGDKHAVGNDIAAYAAAFEAALRASGLPTKPDAAPIPAQPATGILGAILALLRTIFGGNH